MRPTSDPVKEGCAFAGWYKDSACTLLWNFETEKITGDAVIYAKWSANSNTIIFDKNSLDATGNMDSQTVATGASANLLANGFIRTNYVFSGWALTPGGEKQYDDEALFTMGSEESVTLYALWTLNTHVVSFESNGGSEIESQTVTHLNKAEQPAPSPAKTGYIFAGWYKEATLTTQWDFSTDTVSQSVTLWAKWTAASNTVVFDKNASEATGTMENQTISTDSTATLTLNAFVRAGYTFAGWATSAEGEIVYADGASYVMGTSGITLYAKWTVNNNTLIFDKNISGATGSMANLTIATGAKADLTQNSFAMAGYVFTGWNTQPDGAGTPYADKAEFIMGASASVTLYAQWRALDYTISYNLDGGTNHAGNPSTYTTETAAITLQNPSKTGYIFKGWTPEGTIAKGSTGNKEFTAAWEEVVYTVTYNLNGGTNHAGNPASYTVESTAITLQTPEKAGYTFGGWFTTEAFTTQITSLAGGEVGDVTLWAKWNIVEYTITYVLGLNGVNGEDNPVSYTVETAEITLTAPARAGYGFARWEDESGAAVTGIAKGSTGNKTFTAVWSSALSYTITYNLNGGTNHVGNPSTYTTETAAIALQNPSKTGYVFKGWTPEGTIAKGSTGNKEFTAAWEEIIYTITYNLNGGTNHAGNPSTYTTETAAITLQTPSKTGYTFGGWFTTAAFTTQIASLAGGEVGDVTLWAKWTADSKTFTLYANYVDAGSPAVINSYTNEEITLADNIFARAGYTFIYWTAQADGGGTKYYAGEKFVVNANNDINKLYAVWAANTNTITFDKNATDATGTMGNQTIATDATANLNANAFTRNGYTFAGWANSAGGEAVYIDGASYKMGGANVTLYAKWVINEFTYSLNGDNASYTLTGYNGSATTISIPFSYNGKPVTAMGISALAYNTRLVNVIIPDSITSISVFAFSGCTSLESVTIPGSVTYIGMGAFYMCTSLKSIIIPSGVTIIPQAAFTGCTSLASINIPNGVTSIGSEAFKGCASLTTLVIPDSVAYIDNTVFSGCTNITFYAAAASRPNSWDVNWNSDARPVYWAGEWIYVDGVPTPLRNIVFDKNDSFATGSMNVQQIGQGATVALSLNTFERAGYTFAGWATSASGGVIYTNGADYAMGSANVTFYAKWSANSNTITFNANGGTGTMGNQSMATDATANLNANAFTRNGYTFAGWATSAGGEIVYADGASYVMGTGSVNLYAVWSAASQTLTFYANNASGATAAQTIATDATANLNANTFTKSGYTFVGWACNPTATEAEYSDGALYTMQAGGGALYAVWTAEAKTLTFNANGATGGSTADILSNTDKNVTLPSCGFTKEGHTFNGWNTASNGSGMAYSVGSTYKMTAGDNALYAQWTVNQYTYTFYDEDGITVLKTATADYGSVITAPTNPTKTATAQYSYAFDKWEGFTAGMTLAGDISFKAKYGSTVNQYTYTFYDEDGITVLKTATADYGSVITAPASPVKTATAQYSYAFTGWDKAVPSTLTNNITFTAQYSQTVNQYTVTFNSQGGTAVASQNISYGSKATLPSPAPTRENYIFGGWYKEASCTNAWDFATDAVTGATTLYAKWTAVIYTVTYNLDGGTNHADNPANYTVETAAVTLQNPTKTGYSFVGWENESGNPVTVIAGGSAGDIALYAKWEVLSNNIVVFDKNASNATGTMENQTIAEGTSAKLNSNAFTRSNYTFAGWALTPAGGVAYDNEASYTMASSGVTLYAVWKAWSASSVFEFTYNGNGGYTLTNYTYNWSVGTDLVIPATYSSGGGSALPVTAIGYQAFMGSTSVTSVLIPNSVTSIEQGAFSLCTKLKSVNIPSGVTSIGSNAFQGCTSLEKVTIASGVTHTGYGMFYGCTSLASVNIPSSVTSIGQLSFYKCASITSLVIPNSVTDIGQQAFDGCTNLTTLTISSGLISISDHAFYGCTSLESLTIPNSVKSIGKNAFSGCIKLTSLSLPGSLTSLGESAFSNCTSLTSVIIENGATVIGGFKGCTNLKSVTIPNSVKTISDYAFQGCTSLTNISIGSGVTSIGRYAFDGCTGLTSIVIPDGVTDIGAYAIYNCTNITIYAEAASQPSGWLSGWNTNGRTVYWANAWEIVDGAPKLIYGFSYNSETTSYILTAYYGSAANLTLPSVYNKRSVAAIGENAFYMNSKLVSITIPDSITSIGKSAFQNCTSLANISIGSGVASIGEQAFFACPMQNIIIPLSVTSIGGNAFNFCDNLTIYCEAASRPEGWNTSWNSRARPVYWAGEWEIVDGLPTPVYEFTLNTDGTSYTLSKYNGSGGSITIPSAYNGLPVTKIGENIFKNKASLISVAIPAGITNIGAFAFYDCANLKSVTLGSGVEIIGSFAFGSCVKLANISIPSGVTSIGFGAFSLCSSLLEVTIPYGVISIDGEAFYGCSNLISVIIPDSVSLMGESAFGACSKLSIYCQSEQEPAQWSFNGNEWNPYPCPVYWAGEWTLVSGTPKPVYEFIINTDGTSYTLSKYNGSAESVTIPSTYNGLPVTKIGDGSFARNETIRSIAIPNGITTIGNYAFDGVNLGELIIPDSVTGIGSYAFFSCLNLAKLTLGSGVESIGDYAFAECEKLTSVVIPNSVTSIDGYAFYLCSSLKIYCEAASKPDGWVADWNPDARPVYWGGTWALVNDILMEATAASNFTYADNGDGTCVLNSYTGTIANVVIPSSINGLQVKSIGAKAFYNNQIITSVKISDGIVSIGQEAFSFNSIFYSSSLTSITLGKNVVVLGEKAFDGCKKITSIVLPSGITSISNNAFSSCSGLTNIIIPNSVTSIGASAFSYCTSLTTIIIPNSVKSIGTSAFSGCNLTSLTIGSGVTSLDASFVNYCTKLTSIIVDTSNTAFKSVDGNIYSKDGTVLWRYATGKTAGTFEIPVGVTGIGEYAFNSCTSLASVIIPDSVTNIGANAFYGCKNINSIIMPDSVKNIGANAFRNCTGLTNITTPTSVTSIGTSAFDSCTGLTAATVKNGSIGSSAFSDCTKLATLTLESGVTSIENRSFANCTSLTNLTIPNTVKTISDWAFIDCTKLANIIFENGIESIGYGSFSGCNSLTSLTIPNSVKSIGDSAFASCTNLTSATLGSGVTSIREGLFKGCKKLLSITVNEGNTAFKSVDGNLYSKDGTALWAYAAGKTATSFVIPNTVTSISGYAFYGCTNLKSITIPDSITSIGMQAFANCTSITKIIIPISVTRISYSAFMNCAQLAVYCRVASQPSEWISTWNTGVLSTTWGYTGS